MLELEARIFCFDLRILIGVVVVDLLRLLHLNQSGVRSSDNRRILKTGEWLISVAPVIFGNKKEIAANSNLGQLECSDD
jgi:hypothetical protein